jgi:hypothetical protein
MITKTHFQKFRVNEVLQFLYDTLALCDKHDPAKLLIISQINTLRAATNDLNKVYKIDAGSMLSDVLSNYDDLRDMCLTGIKLNAESFTYHFDPDIKTAAQYIYNSIRSHGPQVTRQNYPSETSSINDILSGWVSNAQQAAALTTLNLNAWATELKRLNNLFNTTYVSRIKETSELPQQSTLEMRKMAIESFRKLTTAIEAHITLATDAVYTVMENELNALIQKYNNIVDARDKDDKDTGATPSKIS